MIDQLDKKFAEFHENEQILDRWVRSKPPPSTRMLLLHALTLLTGLDQLIETLFKSVDRAWEKQQTARKSSTLRPPG
jgi:hypothetical protein